MMNMVYKLWLRSLLWKNHNSTFVFVSYNFKEFFIFETTAGCHLKELMNRRLAEKNPDKQGWKVETT